MARPNGRHFFLGPRAAGLPVRAASAAQAAKWRATEATVAPPVNRGKPRPRGPGADDLSPAAPRPRAAQHRTPSVSSTLAIADAPDPRTATRSAPPGPATGTLISRRIVVLGRAACARNSIAVRPWRTCHDPSGPRHSTTTRCSAGSVRTMSKRSCQAPHTATRWQAGRGRRRSASIQRRRAREAAEVPAPTIRSFGPRTRASRVSLQRARAEPRRPRTTAANSSARARERPPPRADARGSPRRPWPAFAAGRRPWTPWRGRRRRAPQGSAGRRRSPGTGRAGRAAGRQAVEEPALVLEAGDAPPRGADVPSVADLPPRVADKRPRVAGERVPGELPRPREPRNTRQSPGPAFPWRRRPPARATGTPRPRPPPSSSRSRGGPAPRM